jgi:hypothetical protein
MLVTTVAFGLVGGAVDFAVPGLLSADARALRAALENASFADARDLMGLTYSCLVLFVFGGLYFLKSWARAASVVLMLIGAMYEITWQYQVWSGWAHAMNHVHLLLWGALLAMSYSGALNDSFTTKATNG